MYFDSCIRNQMLQLLNISLFLIYVVSKILVILSLIVIINLYCQLQRSNFGFKTNPTP